jgi:hypothetical protein
VDGAITLFRASKVNPTLQELALDENDISVSGVMAIADAAYYNTTLQKRPWLSRFGIVSTKEVSSNTPTFGEAVRQNLSSDRDTVLALINIWLEDGRWKAPVNLVVVVTLAVVFYHALERISSTLLYGKAVEEDLTADCANVYGLWKALLNLVVSVTRTAVFHHPLEMIWNTPKRT